jgi:hypothetical protein
MSENSTYFSIENVLIPYSVVAYAVLVSLLVWREILQWWRERKEKKAAQNETGGEAK